MQIKSLVLLALFTTILFFSCNDDDTPLYDDPAQISWVERADCPSSMSDYFSHAIGDDIYYISKEREMWAYNINTDIWLQKAEVPSGRFKNSFYLDDDLYIFSSSELFLGFYKYNVNTNSWSESDLPLPLDDSGKISVEPYFSINGKISNGSLLYDPDKNEWEPINDSLNVFGIYTYNSVYEINKKGYTHCYGKIYELDLAKTKNWVLKNTIERMSNTDYDITFLYNGKIYIYYLRYDNRNLNFSVFDVEKNELKSAEPLLPSVIDIDHNRYPYSTINIEGRVFMGPFNGSFWEMEYNDVL